MVLNNLVGAAYEASSLLEEEYSPSAIEEGLTLTAGVSIWGPQSDGRPYQPNLQCIVVHLFDRKHENVGNQETLEHIARDVLAPEYMGFPVVVKSLQQ